MAQDRAEPSEARRSARGATRRHDIPAAPTGREVPAEVYQHESSQLRAQPYRESVHRSGQAQRRGQEFALSCQHVAERGTDIRAGGSLALGA